MKSSSSLCPGLIFRRGPASYEVLQLQTDNTLLCRRSGTNNEILLPKLQFLSEYESGHIFDLQSEDRPFRPLNGSRPRVSAVWEQSSMAQQAIATCRWEIIQAVEGEGPITMDMKGKITNTLQRVCQAKGLSITPSRSTFHEWYKAFIRSNRSIESLLPQTRSRHALPRKRRIAPEVQGILQEHLDQYVQGRFSRSGAEWAAEINIRIDAENTRRPQQHWFKPISQSTWVRAVRNLPAIKRTAAQRGKKEAAREYAAVGESAKPEFPLQVLFTDHTNLAIECYEPAIGLYFNEVWLTALRCAKTQCILGFTLHVARYNTEVVERCFAHAVMPKHDLKKRYPHLKHDWPMHGLPQLIFCDNGAEFLGKSFNAFAAHFGISLKYAPVYSPWLKGAIERFWRTVKDRMIKRILHERKLSHRNDKSAWRPAPTLDQLYALITEWIVDIYHQEPKQSLDLKSPRQVWEQCSGEFYVALPASEADLYARIGAIEIRTLQKYGVQINNDRYHSPELADLFAEIGSVDVKVSCSSRSAYRVFVVHPHSSEYIPAYNQNPQCPRNYTRAEWDTLKSIVRQNNGDLHAPEDIGRANAMLEQFNTRLRKEARTRKRDAKKMVRAKDSGPSVPPQQDTFVQPETFRQSDDFIDSSLNFLDFPEAGQ